MLNANHWFVANDRGPELRISTWSAHNRTRAAVRHLCGHKCLHKLVDDFMAKTQSARASASVETENAGERPATLNDTTLAWAAPHRMQALPKIGSSVENFESSAQLIKPAEQIAGGASRQTTLRVEAWKRERQRLAEQSTTRRSIA
jgi:hypothetical protein